MADQAEVAATLSALKTDGKLRPITHLVGNPWLQESGCYAARCARASDVSASLFIAPGNIGLGEVGLGFYEQAAVAGKFLLVDICITGHVSITAKIF